MEISHFVNTYLKDVPSCQKIGSKAFLQCFGLRRFIFPTISTRLATITPAGRSRVEHKIDEVSLLERRDSEVLIYAEALIRSGIFGADILGPWLGLSEGERVGLDVGCIE